MKFHTPNYTQVPNVLLDEMLPTLGYAELKVILFIIRKTIGYHKTSDIISLSQLKEGTGLDKKNIAIAVDSLIEKGLIEKNVVGPNGISKTHYSLVLHEFSNNSDQVRKTGGTSGVKQPVEDILNSEIASQENKKSNTRCVKHPTKESVLKKEEERKSSSSFQISIDKNVSKFTGITNDMVDSWKKVYPGLDIIQELSSCLKKALASGENRDNWASYILNWLQNAKQAEKSPGMTTASKKKIEEKMKNLQEKFGNEWEFVFSNTKVDFRRKESSNWDVIYYDTLDYHRDIERVTKKIKGS